MKCEFCGQENHDRRRKFCKKCHSPLPRSTAEKPAAVPQPVEEKTPQEETTGAAAIAIDTTKVALPSGAGDTLICPTADCRYQNKPGMFFCYQCGTPLVPMIELPADKRFFKEGTVLPPSLRKVRLVLADNSEIEITSASQLIGRDDLKRAVSTEREMWISREHFWIYYENGSYYIEDKKSTNDTSLHGRLIKGAGKIELHDGDLIEVSPTDRGPATVCTVRIVN